MVEMEWLVESKDAELWTQKANCMSRWGASRKVEVQTAEKWANVGTLTH